jgi:hypothetical protein
MNNNKRKPRKSNPSTSLHNVVANNHKNKSITSISIIFGTNSNIKIKRRKLEQGEEEKALSDIYKRLSELNQEEMKTFNLEDIDETELIKKTGDGVYKKIRELLTGRIIWAERRDCMWPAKIVKVTGSSKSSLKINIRCYELNRKLGSIFEMDSFKIEMFYKCKEHEQYKVIGAINPAQRKEFNISYTNALKDYIQLIEEAKTTTTIQNIKIKEDEEEIDQDMDKKYLILGKKYSIEDIKELASKSYSNEQIEENKSREKNSKNLFNLVTSKECDVSFNIISLQILLKEEKIENTFIFVYLRII